MCSCAPPGSSPGCRSYIPARKENHSANSSSVTDSDLFILQKIRGCPADLKPPPPPDVTPQTQASAGHSAERDGCGGKGGAALRLDRRGERRLLVLHLPQVYVSFADSKPRGASKAWDIVGRRITQTIDGNTPKQAFLLRSCDAAARGSQARAKPQ